MKKLLLSIFLVAAISLGAFTLFNTDTASATEFSDTFLNLSVTTLDSKPDVASKGDDLEYKITFRSNYIMSGPLFYLSKDANVIPASYVAKYLKVTDTNGNTVSKYSNLDSVKITNDPASNVVNIRYTETLEPNYTYELVVGAKVTTEEFAITDTDDMSISTNIRDIATVFLPTYTKIALDVDDVTVPVLPPESNDNMSLSLSGIGSSENEIKNGQRLKYVLSITPDRDIANPKFLISKNSNIESDSYELSEFEAYDDYGFSTYPSKKDVEFTNSSDYLTVESSDGSGLKAGYTYEVSIIGTATYHSFDSNILYVEASDANGTFNTVSGSIDLV